VLAHSGDVPAPVPARLPRASGAFGAGEKAPGWRVKHTFPHGAIVNGVAFGPDVCASWGEDGFIRLWDLKTGKAGATHRPHPKVEPVKFVYFLPDARHLFAVSGAGQLTTWEFAKQGALGRTFECTDTVLGLGRDQQSLGILFDNGVMVMKFELPAFEIAGRQSRLARGQGTPTCVDFSGDGARAGTGFDDGAVGVWDTDNRQERWLHTNHVGGVYRVAFSPDDKLLASAGKDGLIVLWDTATGTAKAKLVGHKKGVRALAFSQDGKALASGSADHTVRLWDVAAGKETALLKGHDGPVTGVAFNRDGMQLLSGSADNSARLWQVALKAAPRPKRPPSFPGDAGTPEHQRARQLVGRLDSTMFRERDEAQKQLGNLGPAALVALKEGAASPDLEVRSRCRLLLPAARSADWARRADAFERDTRAEYLHRLPLRDRFEKAVGTVPGARRLYAEIVRREGVLLEEVVAAGNAGLEAYQARCARLESALSVPAAAAERKSSEAELAAPCLASLALRDSHGEKNATEKPSSVARLLASPPAFAALQDKEFGPAFRRLLLAWLEGYELNTPNVDEVRVAIASLNVVRVHRLKEALPAAEKIAGNEYAPPWLRAFAVEILAQEGAESSLPVLEKLFDTPGSPITRGGGAEEGRVGDHALGHALHIRGLVQSDYSLLRKKESAKMGIELPGGRVYEMRFFYFRSPEERQQALLRWSAEAARKKDPAH
jgi:hypothetical protein